MNLFYKLAKEYIDFEVMGKKVVMPYCIVDVPYDRSKHPMGRTDKFHNYAGKGTPQQIYKVLIKTAKRKTFNLQRAKPEEITQFMIDNGIGIDCSGFVYNILNAYLQQEKHTSLAKYIYRYPGILGKLENFLLRKNRIRRSSATTLTSELNTIKIEKTKDIRPGDMIRLTHADWPGKHIAIIVEVHDDYIIYAMASEYMKIRGAHSGKIKILNKNKGLEDQNWLEITYDGKNYRADAYDSKRGDSVRRLSFLVFSAKFKNY